jgi:2-phosphosulfolactate phosphatase
MINVEVVLLPSHLQSRHLQGRAVVVLDVLRATTSMAAALAAGVREIRVFSDTQSALAAGNAFGDVRILCGEEQCLPPAGFDLGNSPGAFARERHCDRVAFMSTTNGTKAIYAARGASRMYIGALVNASATARALVQAKLDVTLLCAGANGQIALVDVLGAGAVLDALDREADLIRDSDAVLIARRAFAAARDHLLNSLRESRGGQYVMSAGLGSDIEFAARIDSIQVVGEIFGVPPVVRRA